MTGDPHVVHGCDNVCCLVSRSVETKRVDEDLQIDNDFRYLAINIHNILLPLVLHTPDLFSSSIVAIEALKRFRKKYVLDVALCY